MIIHVLSSFDDVKPCHVLRICEKKGFFKIANSVTDASIRYMIDLRMIIL